MSIRDRVLEIVPSVESDFRYLHRNAELSFEESKTSVYIRSVLDELDVSYSTVNTTTTVAVLSNNDSEYKNTIVLRADIDALPIVEDSSIDGCSLNSGVMHACGHDFHTSSLLGVVRFLKSEIQNLSATFVFIFQQGEELLPGGAIKVIESGILEKYNPKMIIGQHIEYSLDSGVFGVCEGLYMASGDEIHLEVVGKGGHAAVPSTTNSPIYPTCEMILSIKDIESLAPEGIPTVISLGFVEAKGATNIVPERVTVQGTFRTMNEQWRARAKQIMRQRVDEIAAKYSVEANLNIIKGYPMLNNNSSIAKSAKAILSGVGRVENLGIRLTTEDFGEYATRYPSLFYRVGVHNPGWGEYYPPHTSRFKADRAALAYSVEGMCRLALELVLDD